MCKNYSRKLETKYTHSLYIAEFWNTISNLPFIIIGILRLIELEPNYFELEYLYTFMVLAGFASGFHHAMHEKWTILIDWIPILISIYLFIHYDLLQFVSYASLFQFGLAMFVLLTDHIYTTIPVPWGHVMWHILACFSIDSIYQSVRRYNEF